VISTSFSFIRLISRVRRSLSKGVCKQLVHALVFSRIDYCSSLLFKLPKASINKLQRVINASIRLIEKLRKTESLSVHLRSHNVLPVHKRIEKRVLTIVFKCLHNMAPSYLQSLLILSSSASNRYHTRSQSHGVLSVQRCAKKIGERAFSIHGPLLWNKLSHDVRDLHRLSTFVASITKQVMNGE
jgi:hypothetical protein